MEPRYKFSFGYFLMLFTLMLFLDSLFFSGPAVHEIPYNKFRDLIQADKVQSVILEQDRIYGLEKAPPAADTSTSEIAPSKGQAGFAPHQKRTLKVFPKFNFYSTERPISCPEASVLESSVGISSSSSSSSLSP